MNHFISAAQRVNKTFTEGLIPVFQKKFHDIITLSGNYRAQTKDEVVADFLGIRPPSCFCLQQPALIIGQDDIAKELMVKFAVFMQYS